VPGEWIRRHQLPIAVAGPNVTSVVNAASYISPGLPNAGIAQGAIFVVFGSGLGPANISFAPAAFQSTTPTGTGTITATYNGQASNAAPITVVANNLGIFTIGSNGQGPGIVTYPDYSLVSAAKDAQCGGPNTTCGAANPGDTLSLWATGLGPVSGNEASGAGLGQNMPNVPLTVWLGGVQAPVVYQGRCGCCIGEDQIVFTVPNNVPTACAVPLLVQAGTFLVPGAYTITGTGGADIGPFTATITIPAFPTLVSPLATNFTVTRSSGMTVNWSGNGSTGNVLIQVSGATDNTFATGANAVCTAPASAGTFTVPPYALLTLPAGNFGALSFQQLTAAVPFIASRQFGDRLRNP